MLFVNSNFETARILGLIGSVLIIVGVIEFFIILSFFGAVSGGVMKPSPSSPFEVSSSSSSGAYAYFPLFSIIGWALIIASLYRFSRVYGENRMFYYAIFSVVSIVGCTILAILLLLFLATALPKASTSFIMIPPLIVFISGFILMGFFMYRALDLLAEKTGEDLLRTASILMLIAAVTLVVFIGIIFELGGAIALTIAFQKLKPPQPQKPVEEIPIKLEGESLRSQKPEPDTPTPQ